MFPFGKSVIQTNKQTNPLRLYFFLLKKSKKIKLADKGLKLNMLSSSRARAYSIYKENQAYDLANRATLNEIQKTQPSEKLC